jgi:hypothetical protein
MTDLDRRVAELRGWTWDELDGYVWRDSNAVVAVEYSYSPSTNLLQAYKLWDEARPEGCFINVLQQFDALWNIQVMTSEENISVAYNVAFTDLPRAITEAWVEAREAICQK